MAIGVYAASLPESRAATTDVVVRDFGDEAGIDRALVRGGASQASLRPSPDAPLLPGGEQALAAVRNDVARTIGITPAAVADLVRVRDSQHLPIFDYDRPIGRRLVFQARAGNFAEARRLATTFASAYVKRRETFFAALQLNAADRLGLDVKELEQHRLYAVDTRSTLDAVASPTPVRDAVVAAMACLSLVVLVARLRRRSA